MESSPAKDRRSTTVPRNQQQAAQHSHLFIYLFIYYYSTEGPKATYTVGKSTRSEKHM